jgi:hypothetical protein
MSGPPVQYRKAERREKAWLILVPLQVTANQMTNDEKPKPERMLEVIMINACLTAHSMFGIRERTTRTVDDSKAAEPQPKSESDGITFYSSSIWPLPSRLGSTWDGLRGPVGYRILNVRVFASWRSTLSTFSIFSITQPIVFQQVSSHLFQLH